MRKLDDENSYKPPKPFYSPTSSIEFKQEQLETFIVASAGKKVKSWLNAPNKMREVEVLPNITNFHPGYVPAMKFLAGQDGSQFKEEPRHLDGCLLDPFIVKSTANFGQFAGSSFYPMGLNPPLEPMSVKPSPLSVRIKTRLDKFFHGVKLVPHSVDKDSTTSFNLLSKEMKTKAAKIDIMLHFAEQIISLASSNIDAYEYFYELNHLCGAFNMFMERRRFQVEDVAKIREVFSAASRELGKKVKVGRDFNGYGLLDMRARLVFAGDFIINQMIGPLADWTRSYWKISPVGSVIYINRQTIASQIGSRSHIRSYDVSNFDNNLRSFFIDWFLDYMGQIYDEDVINVARRFLRGAMLAKRDGFMEKGAIITAYPSYSGMTSNFGNPSGWSWVSDFAKYVGLIVFGEINVMALHCYRKGIKLPEKVDFKFFDSIEPDITDEDIDAILSNGNPELIWFSCGDDNLPCAESEELQNIIGVFAPVVGSRYELPITVEDIASFTGLSFIKNGDNVRCVSNVMNIISKRLLAETSISYGKTNVSAGFWVAMTNYSDHPRFEEYLGLLDQVCVDYFQSSLKTLYPKVPFAQDNDNRFNAATALWLEDRSAHHYGKVDLADVHPDVLAEAFYSRPAIDYKYALRRIKPGVEVIQDMPLTSISYVK